MSAHRSRISLLGLFLRLGSNKSVFSWWNLKSRSQYLRFGIISTTAISFYAAPVLRTVVLNWNCKDNQVSKLLKDSVQAAKLLRLYSTTTYLFPRPPPLRYTSKTPPKDTPLPNTKKTPQKRVIFVLLRTTQNLLKGDAKTLTQVT